MATNADIWILFSSLNRLLNKHMICRWFETPWHSCDDNGILHYRDHFVHAPSRWETTLHCNVVSHWLGAYTLWSLHPPSAYTLCFRAHKESVWRKPKSILLYMPCMTGCNMRNIIRHGIVLETHYTPATLDCIYHDSFLCKNAYTEHMNATSLGNI